MKEKIGLKIVDLLHSIARRGYSVTFSPDLEGMIRIHFDAQKPWLDEIEDHHHLGYPECERIVLEKAIIKCLSDFLGGLKDE